VKIEHLTRLLDAEYGAGFKAGVEAAAKVADEWYGRASRTADGVAAQIRALSPVEPPTREHDHTSDSGDCLACLVPPVREPPREREGCAACHGTGGLDFDGPACPACGGTGECESHAGTFTAKCPACNHAAA
jgi:hypothetical protein